MTSSNGMRPTFSNKPNPKLKLLNGEYIRHSRSCAVVAEIFLYSAKQDAWFTLLGLRGEMAPDFQGLWGFPCGYLDWNETLYQAALREVWEETGLCLTDFLNSRYCTKSYGLFNPEDEMDAFPWKISDTSRDEKQNVSFHFGIFIRWESEALPVLSIENSNAGESDDAAWIPMQKALTMTLAFSHSKRLGEIWLNQKNRFDSVSIM